MAHLPDLKAMLQGSNADAKLLTPFGVLSPPLGTLRLKAAEMVLMLVTIDEPSARQGESAQRRSFSWFLKFVPCKSLKPCASGL